MNVAVCWANVFPRDLAFHLTDIGVYEHCRWLDTSGPQGYWDTLRRLWEDQQTVIVLEGDKFPAPGALQALWACDQSWCSYPVPMRAAGDAAPYPSLACTKFAAPVMRQVPDLMQWVGELDLGLGVREWSRLDMAIAGLLQPLLTCHMHEPGQVEHRHPTD